jgi:ribose/xylose/arabinose/galactoside ABC-type transport system permease subunit
MRLDAPPWQVLPVALGVSMGIGLLAGLVNGGLIVSLRLHPFIVTLGTLAIFRGIANVSTQIKTLPSPGMQLPHAFTPDFMRMEIPGLPAARALVLALWLVPVLAGIWIFWRASEERIPAWRLMVRLRLIPGPDQRPLAMALAVLTLLASLFALYLLFELTLAAFAWDQMRPTQPMPLIIMLACVLCGWIYLHFMVAGRETYAIGGNEEAARFSGLRVNAITVRVYVLAGITAGLAGLVSLGRFGTASTSTGTGYELTVIAAAVVGGASLSGGRGTALGALLGTLIIALIENGIYILHLQQEYRSIIIGVAIILAVALDRFSEYLRNRRLAGAK